MMLHRSLTATLAAAALTAGLSFQAAAQSEVPTAATVTDAELQSFAAATVEIQMLVAEWRPQIESAATPERRAELNQQAEAEMVQVVTDHGLSVEDYTGYAELAQSDPEFMARVQAEMQSQ